MLFIGSGYIGMEFAHIAARMGVKVTVMDLAPRPLSNFDEDLVGLLQKASEEIGVKFIFNAEVEKIEKLQKNFRVTAKQNEKDITATAELIFNTSGRVPSIEDLDLEKGNVKFSKKGIVVNEFLQSVSNKNVLSCGDVSDSEGLPLTPLSSYESAVVAKNVLKEKGFEKIKYPPQPSVVFTLPNLASIGLSEAAAKKKVLK
nr:FAD-dependent oxidoreductase [Antarcticibacterium sp. 1MA-6-2]